MGMVSQFCGRKSWIFSGEFVPLEEVQVQFKLLKSPTLDLNNNSKCLTFANARHSALSAGRGKGDRYLFPSLFQT